ncbi:MAG: hypothetical protein OXU81_06035 [Gammaproteobacteria bacterium]|nr:hypothetical protein [Gammaproteobacteria bacterium]
MNELIDAVVAEKPLRGSGLEIEHLAASAPAAPPVSLASVSEPSHVNALSSTAPLTFPASGITIVYGDNGSGKSGYARLLKRIARSRHSETVLTDVFRDTPGIDPTAKLRVRIGREVHDVNWPESKRSELQRMLFYDNACGNTYIANEADFPYRPYALFVMDGLIDGCVRMQTLIDAKLNANARRAQDTPRATLAARDTQPARFLAALNASSSVEKLDALFAKLKSPGMSIGAVEAKENALRSSDTRQARRELMRTAQKLDALSDHIQLLDSTLGPGPINELVRATEELRQLEHAAKHHAESLRAEALPGVGSDAWRMLWDAAKRFSEDHAYVHRQFPVSGGDSRCVLCLQPLGEPGSSVMTRLDRFVRNDIQIRREESRRIQMRLLKTLTSLEVFPGAVNSHVQDLQVSHSDDTDAVKTLLAQYATAQKAAVTTASTEGVGAIEAPEATRVTAVVEKLRRAAAESLRLAEDLDDPQRTAIRLREVTETRREIELLTEMKGARSDIVAEIARLAERRRLERLKQAANTGPITRKILDLSEETITEVVRDRFTRETDRLGLDRVTIAKTKAERGALLHLPKLVGARQITELSRVFSEGERTALGLAACFTEAALDESNSGLILDDPVTSLDHIRRERVAQRLVDFAQSRQVIVFTHDVAFVAELKGAAFRQQVVVAERWVARSRAGEKLPGFCTDTHPWKAKDVRARLGELREDLAKLRKQSSQFDDQQYENAVAGWAGRLSETWERILSQEVVGPIMADGGLEVRPMMVKVLAEFTKEDYIQFNDSYGRVSRWTKRHDKSAHLNYVAPQLDELEEELSLVDQWFRRVKNYK